MNRTVTASLSIALLLACLPAVAQYKVIGADGSVTYTDRPPSTPNVKVTTLGRESPAALPAATAAAGVDTALPFELRQAAARFPVTLYTAAECAPCDNGRQFLQQRGVPFSERLVVSEDDAAALERSVGGRTLPALTVGSQALRGLSTDEWSGYLDAAGYPRESRLPRGWQAPAPTVLVERVPAPRAAAPVAPARPTTPPADIPAAELPPQVQPGVRF
jgi:glutaredoxin